MASNSNDTINPDDIIISFDTMNQAFQLVKLFRKYYHEYKQQHQQ